MPHRNETDEELMVIIKDTMEKGGKVLIPTLGVGRAQEVMLAIGADGQGRKNGTYTGLHRRNGLGRYSHSHSVS